MIAARRFRRWFSPHDARFRVFRVLSFEASRARMSFMRLPWVIEVIYGHGIIPDVESNK
jgi:hypothetical protein